MAIVKSLRLTSELLKLNVKCPEIPKARDNYGFLRKRYKPIEMKE